MKKTIFKMTAIALLLSLGACLGQSDADLQTKMKSYIESEEGRNVIGNSVEEYFKKKQEEMRAKQERADGQDLEEQFKNPVKIEAGNSPVKGPKDAKITIIEFSDFQCPFCKRGKDTMDQILKAYPKDVKLVFKHLPLEFHKQAKPAAIATLAAGKQGKFWEMHDIFFDNQQSLNEEFIMTTAQKLGLNMDKFKADMASDEIAKQVKDDSELARKNGISGTPGFFVNGVAVKGAYPYDHFKGIIDRWLNK